MTHLSLRFVFHFTGCQCHWNVWYDFYEFIQQQWQQPTRANEEYKKMILCHSLRFHHFQRECDDNENRTHASSSANGAIANRTAYTSLQCSVHSVRIGIERTLWHWIHAYWTNWGAKSEKWTCGPATRIPFELFYYFSLQNAVHAWCAGYFRVVLRAPAFQQEANLYWNSIVWLVFFARAVCALAFTILQAAIGSHDNT